MLENQTVPITTKFQDSHFCHVEDQFIRQLRTIGSMDDEKRRWQVLAIGFIRAEESRLSIKHSSTTVRCSYGSNSMRFVNWKEYKRVAAQLHTIYQAATGLQAMKVLEQINAKDTISPLQTNGAVIGVFTHFSAQFSCRLTRSR